MDLRPPQPGGLIKEHAYMLWSKFFLTVLGKEMPKSRGIRANLPHFLALMVLLILMVLVLELRLFSKDTWAIIVGYNHQIISHLNQSAPP